MKEEMDGIYDKPNFGKIVALFVVAFLVFLIAALLFFRSGHPFFPTHAQPKNNKGFVLPVSADTSPRAV